MSIPNSIEPPNLYRYVNHGQGHFESNSCIVGISTGLLAAAAVALAPAVSLLLPLAVNVVLIAFRIGVCIDRVAYNLEDSTGHEGDSWSYVLPGKTEDEAQAALDEFHHERVSDDIVMTGLWTHSDRQPYIRTMRTSVQQLSTQ